MKKFKIGTSFFLLIVLCLATKSFLIFINYLLALFFHELAHLLVATKKGYSLNLIKLDIFGLSIDLKEPIDEKDNFAINIAGPMINLFLCLICLSLYWLIPNSYFYLNTFCFSNLILAIFNLLPIYPLDGGKIFRGMITSDRTYKIMDILFRCSFAFVCIVLFIFNLKYGVNFIFLILALFFLITNNKTPTVTVFKFKQNKNFDKVVILKVEENENLFQMIKKIKPNHYTIFYLPKTKRYIDEEEVIILATKYPLTTNCQDAK